MQEFGQSLKVSVIEAWVKLQFHHIGKEYAKRERSSTLPIATES